MPRHLLLLLGGISVLPLIAASSCETLSPSSSRSSADQSQDNSQSQSTSPPTQSPPAQPATRQITGKAVTLGAGTFKGGTDVVEGLYDVTPGAGQSGNFIVNGTDSYDEILGTVGGAGGVPTVRAQISAGDSIEISGLSKVTFTPVTTPFVTTHTLVKLGAGTWTVGQDVGAGRYVATPGAGQSGNFIVTGADSYDEILGNAGAAGGVPNLSVTLTDGDVIAISGMSQVVMTPQ